MSRTGANIIRAIVLVMYLNTMGSICIRVLLSCLLILLIGYYINISTWNRSTVPESKISISHQKETPAVNQNIYLLETSGRNSLDLRQLASVESIARFVQHDNITVLIFSNQTIEYNAVMLALNSTYGVRFVQSEMGPFFVGTPLEIWYNSGVWTTGKFRTAHCSDALRAALIWHRGGIYLDLDIIMIKPVNFTRPSIVWEPENGLLANFFLAFNKHNTFLKLYMAEFSRTYNPNLYPINGPPLFTRVYKMYSKLLYDTRNTSDIVDLKPEVMTLTPRWQDSNMYFQESAAQSLFQRETSETVGLHIWNSVNGQTRVNATSKCAYIHYVNRSCPLVYAEMLKKGEV